MAVKIKLTFGKNKRLCGKQIRNVFAEGKVYHYRHFVVFYDKKDKEIKCAVVAGKKVGNAVKRNRAKRLLRELFRKNQYKLNCGHYVFVAKKTIVNCLWSELERDFVNFMSKLQ